MRTFLRAGLVGLALVLAAPAAGQDYNKGLEAALLGDYATALREWRPLAEAGDADAQFTLGVVMYDQGHGGPQDYAEAMKWFRLAAEQGHASAQFSLGVMYANGQGVPQDYAEAHMWFNLAAAKGHAGAANSRDVVARRMTPDQIAEAQRLAREWLEKHQQ